MSASPRRTMDVASGGSASRSWISTAGRRRRIAAIAAGTIVAQPLGKAAIRTRPVCDLTMSARLRSAVWIELRIRSACAASASPAGVSRVERPLRTTRTVPTSRSRLRSW